MPTPKAGYRTKDGQRIPSVTTITGAFKESGGLIHWSWKLAYEPLMEARALLAQWDGNGGVPDPLAVVNFLERPVESFDYREARKHAADAGTVAHRMVECHIHNWPFHPTEYAPSLVEAAQPAFDAYLDWAKQTKFTVVESEVALVSETHRFGGTRDAILVDGRRALGDWKSSNAIYPEYLCQLAAYGILDEENGATIDGGYHLLRFSKQESPDDPVHFTHHYWSHLDKAHEAFLTMRKLYALVQDLKKLAK